MAIIRIEPGENDYPQNVQRLWATDAPTLTVHALADRPLPWQNGDCTSVAIFSSIKVSGSLLLRVHDLAQSWRTIPLTVISGFHAPAEEEVWSVLWPDLLDFRSPLPRQAAPRLVKVLNRGMLKKFAAREHHALSTGMLQLLTPFPDHTRRATKETSATRNLLAAALADLVLIVHAEVESQTFHLAQQLQQWHKPIYTLADAGNQHLLELGIGYLPQHPAQYNSA